MNAEPRRPGLVSSDLDNVKEAPCWYVAYTYPRHERAVADQLERKSVEAFLPTFTEMSQWRDRRVKLELPLFPGYIFTRIAAAERVKVLSVPSVIRMLSYRATLAPVSDEEIDTIRLCIQQKAELRPHHYLAVGDWVRVRAGVFEGVQGIVLRHRNGCKLVVSIGLIQQSVAMEIDADLLEKMDSSSRAIQAHPTGEALASAAGFRRDAVMHNSQPN
jgi:transcription antitermination factor NusG